MRRFLIFLILIVAAPLHPATLMLPSASKVQAQWVLAPSDKPLPKFALMRAPSGVRLQAGEGLLVNPQGTEILRSKVNLQSAAWLGKQPWGYDGKHLGPLDSSGNIGKKMAPGQNLRLRGHPRGLYLWGKDQDSHRLWHLPKKGKAMVPLLESEQPIQDAAGDGKTTVVAVDGKLLRLGKRPGSEKILLDRGQDLRGVALLDSLVFYATQDTVGVIQGGQAQEFLKGEGPLLAVSGDTLWVAFASDQSLLRLDHADKFKDLSRQAAAQLRRQKAKAELDEERRRKQEAKALEALKEKQAQAQRMDQEKVKTKPLPQKTAVPEKADGQKKALPAYAHDHWLEVAWSGYTGFQALTEMEAQSAVDGLKHDGLLPLSLSVQYRWKRFMIGFQWIEIDTHGRGITGTATVDQDFPMYFGADVYSLGYDLAFKPLDRLGPVELSIPLRLEYAVIESEYVDYMDQGGYGSQMLFSAGGSFRLHFGRAAFHAQALYHVPFGGSPTVGGMGDAPDPIHASLQGLDLRLGLSLAID